ncbi:MAG: alkaline phosphatase family protein [SAR324 cluster bacterium]|nr:alkaline phosphatase family protein [SAR324 cluster bacterium]
MKKTIVINVVGLTPSLIGEFTPFLADWSANAKTLSIVPELPAVTCSAQSTYLTGVPPSTHGIVANGWYFKDECEIKFWRQSNKLVQAPKIWETARRQDSTFSCANLFWWYNMYSSVDVAVTPRPMYPADGRKIPDIYTCPLALRFELQEELGQFPLFEFWGPRTSIRASQWIADCAKLVEAKSNPDLTLIYLPHLDYNLQRTGTAASDVARDLQEIDGVCQDLIEFYEKRDAQIIVLSEYGITPVNRPIALNRLFFEEGLISIREEMGRYLLDAGTSAAFAVADHQIAHVYLNDPEKLTTVRKILESTEGIAEILDTEGKKGAHLDHPRSGDFVVIAKPDAWFTYYYWLNDTNAPDFARTVDIHRKPGYDPVELFIDPSLPLPHLKAAWILLKKQLGFRYLMDLIPLTPELVKGSHGGLPPSPAEGPLLITRQSGITDQSSLAATEVHDLILKHIF